MAFGCCHFVVTQVIRGQKVSDSNGRRTKTEHVKAKPKDSTQVNEGFRMNQRSDKPQESLTFLSGCLSHFTPASEPQIVFFNRDYQFGLVCKLLHELYIINLESFYLRKSIISAHGMVMSSMCIH